MITLQPSGKHNRTLVARGLPQKHPSDLTELEIQIKYTGASTCENAIPLDNIVIPHIVSKVNGTFEISEAEEARRGEMIVQLLNLREAKQETAHGKLSFDPPRYSTEVGTKTALGLFRTMRRLVEEGQ